jgi:hypothetical protein
MLAIELLSRSSLNIPIGSFRGNLSKVLLNNCNSTHRTYQHAKTNTGISTLVVVVYSRRTLVCILKRGRILASIFTFNTVVEFWQRDREDLEVVKVLNWE